MIPELSNDKAICGAKNKRGEPCRKWPVRGRNRCRLHGGRSPTGLASPNFKTGRWSKYLPKDLNEKYETAQADPFLKTHGPDLSLIDSKLAELLESLDTNNPAEVLFNIRKIWARLVLAKKGGDQPLADKIVRELELEMEYPTPTTYPWVEIYGVLELRRKTLESEQKRLKDQQQMISIEELLILTRFLSESIKTAVVKYADSDIGKSILTDVTRDLALCLSRYAAPRPRSPN